MQDAAPLPSRRGRRVLIALLLMLLILLPLYLWPLRGPSGLPGASALPAGVGDPRSASAVARIPGDVWDALMGHADAPSPALPSKSPARNLTMITQVEEAPGQGLDEGAGPTELARGMLARAGSSDFSGGDPGGASSPAAPTEFLAEGTQAGAGTGNAPGAFAPGGYSNSNLGPWPGGAPGGGPRFSSPGPTLDPGPPGDLAPTPEPATLVLLGSHLALVGAAAWRRRRRRLDAPPTR
jgi:hypothetical protein